MHVLVLMGLACRSPGSDASLQSLSIGPVDVAPDFDPERRYYAVRASSLPSPVRIQAEPADPDANVVVHLETVDRTPLDTGKTLEVGVDQRVRIEVTSADGTAHTTYAVAVLSDTFPELRTVGEAGPGWTFLASFNGPVDPDVARALMVVDDRGTPGWWREVQKPAYDLRISAEGLFTWAGELQVDGGMRHLVMAPEGGEFLRDVGADLPQDWIDIEPDPHEWDVREDGHAIRILTGIVHEDLRPWGGLADHPVRQAFAQEIDGDGNVVFEVSTQGLVDYDLLTPSKRATITKLGWEPLHLNAVEVDPYDGHWLLSLQRASVIAKVARHGPDAGQVLWRLGGPGTELAFVDDDREESWRGFAGQHSVRATGPDRLMLFDNSATGNKITGDVRLVEYALDLGTQEARVVHRFDWTGRGRAYSGGSVQALPSGGHLVGFGALVIDAEGAEVPAVTELSADDDEMWHLYLPGKHWSYRAWRFEGDPLSGGWHRP